MTRNQIASTSHVVTTAGELRSLFPFLTPTSRTRLTALLTDLVDTQRLALELSANGAREINVARASRDAVASTDPDRMIAAMRRSAVAMPRRRGRR